MADKRTICQGVPTAGCHTVPFAVLVVPLLVVLLLVKGVVEDDEDEDEDESGSELGLLSSL